LNKSHSANLSRLAREILFFHFSGAGMPSFPCSMTFDIAFFADFDVS